MRAMLHQESDDNVDRTYARMLPFLFRSFTLSLFLILHTYARDRQGLWRARGGSWCSSIPLFSLSLYDLVAEFVCSFQPARRTKMLQVTLALVLCMPVYVGSLSLSLSLSLSRRNIPRRKAREETHKNARCVWLSRLWVTRPLALFAFATCLVPPPPRLIFE
jgi:hypothetical protein